MPSSLTGSLIRGSPELPNHLNGKKEQLTLCQGFFHLSVTAQVKRKKKKKREEERKNDNGSLSREHWSLDSECSPPLSPSKILLPPPAEDEKPLGFQIC